MRLTVLYDNHSGFRKGLLGAHGFSALIELGGIKVLVDTGTEGEILLNNMRALGVSPEDVDYVFITHGHYDHTGGLKTFLEVREKPIKVIAHPEIFRRRIALKPRRREIGIPFTREELEELGADFVLREEPFEFAPGLWSSGEIPRSTWDMTVGYVEENGNLLRDTVPDDMALIINLGESTAVVTGCGHSGVLNIARHSEYITGKPIRAIIGGLHLINADRDLLDDIIENLRVEELYTGHCTGMASYAYLKAKLGDSVRSLHVGKSFEI